MAKKLSIKEKRKIRKIVIFLLIGLSAIVAVVSVKMYLAYLDDAVSKMEKSEKKPLISLNNEINSKGLYLANVIDDAVEYLKDNNTNSVKYEIANESFYLIFDIIEDNDGQISLMLDTIADEDFNVNAKTNIKDVISIEYATGNKVKSTVIKINTKTGSSYFAMSYDLHYFLGSDIESITFSNDQFYYITFNPKYAYLEEETSCSRQVKNKVEEFNSGEYYYKYGKINFMNSYYQKLASKTYLVREKCSEFEE